MLAIHPVVGISSVSDLLKIRLKGVDSWTLRFWRKHSLRLFGPADLQSFSLFSLDSTLDLVIMSEIMGWQTLASSGRVMSSGASFSSTTTLEKNLFNSSTFQKFGVFFVRSPFPFRVWLTPSLTFLLLWTLFQNALGLVLHSVASLASNDVLADFTFLVHSFRLVLSGLIRVRPTLIL